MNPTPAYDVAVLGSGMAGGMLGAVLARNGVKVLLIDAGTRPRFAVGESTIPYTSCLTRIIAERYQVPEIAPLASFTTIHKKVTPMCGRKLNFGFVYHQQGRGQDPAQINQTVISHTPDRTETHLFRQDVDAYLFHVAVGHGAEPRTGTRITDIDIGPGAGVMLRSDRGEEFTASYLVDGSGFRSPVADRFGLRDEPTRARHHSRSLFTHMVGVTPFDDARAARPHTQPSPWYHGTLHHVFDGGWLWVIPFDNHEEARNRLCSVGLTLDERVFPKPSISPQQEFDEFLRRFPEIAEQFRAAKAVRPWVATGRLQYSASNTVGDRYCLTSHAAGFIDALYSRGLTNTLEIVNSLAWRLIGAAQDGDWSTGRFASIDALQRGLFDVHDDLVYSSFVGFRHYDLWNAVLRVWEAISFLSWLAMEKAYRAFMRDRRDQTFRDLDTRQVPGFVDPGGPDASSLLTFTRTTCQQVEAGTLDPCAAATNIFARVQGAEWIPEPWQRGTPENRCFAGTPEIILSAQKWCRTKAPSHIAPLFSA